MATTYPNLCRLQGLDRFFRPSSSWKPAAESQTDSGLQPTRLSRQNPKGIPASSPRLDRLSVPGGPTLGSPVSKSFRLSVLSVPSCKNLCPSVSIRGRPSPLLFHRQTCFLPRINAPIQVIDRLELVLLKNLQRLRAAPTDSAMDQVTVRPGQTANPLLEIRRPKVDVRRPGNVHRLEFLWRADIEHHHL